MRNKAGLLSVIAAGLTASMYVDDRGKYGRPTGVNWNEPKGDNDLFPDAGKHVPKGANRYYFASDGTCECGQLKRIFEKEIVFTCIARSKAMAEKKFKKFNPG